MAPDLNQIAPNTVGFANLPLEARPFPNWNRVNTRDNGGYQNYHDLVVQVRGDLTSLGVVAHHHLQVGALDRQHRGSRRRPVRLPDRDQRPDGQPLRSRLPPRPDDQHPDPSVREQPDLELPVGRGRAFGSDMPLGLDALAGGWTSRRCPAAVRPAPHRVLQQPLRVRHELLRQREGRRGRRAGSEQRVRRRSPSGSTRARSRSRRSETRRDGRSSPDGSATRRRARSSAPAPGTSTSRRSRTSG